MQVGVEEMGGHRDREARANRARQAWWERFSGYGARPGERRARGCGCGRRRRSRAGITPGPEPLPTRI